MELPTSRALDSAEPAVIRRVSVSPQASVDTTRITTATPFEIGVTIDVWRPGVDLGAFLICRDGQGEAVFSTGSFFEKSLNGVRLPLGANHFRCEVPAPLLNDGEYALDIFLVQDRKDVIATEASVLSFRVEAEALDVDGWHWRPVGVTRPRVSWHLSKQTDGG